MKARGVHLQYRFEADDVSASQRGAALHNPLFDLLTAVHDQGSIQQAAKAMGASYRHVWGELKRWQDVLGEALVVWNKGQPARLTAFAERLLWAETRARTRLTPHIEALRAELQRVLAEALDGSQQVLTVFASHDGALTLLRDLASQAHGLHIELRFAGSVDALRALAQGRCLVAGFHVPPLAGGSRQFAAALKPLLKPGLHKLIGCLRRSQGLMVRPGNPLRIQGLADLRSDRPASAGGPARFVNRQAGSGTRLLMDHLLAEAGLVPESIAGYLTAHEDSDVAVAAALAGGGSVGGGAPGRGAGRGAGAGLGAGTSTEVGVPAGTLADAGPGNAAAAAQFGLGFIPLVEEDYYLVCLKDALDHPAVAKLREALVSPAWPLALTGLPGYAPARSGEVLSLTQALPWWHFRVARKPDAAISAPPTPGSV